MVTGLRDKQLRPNNAHKFFYNQAPEYLQENCKDQEQTTTTQRSSQWNFNVPNVKGNESNRFYFNAIKNWKSPKLPEKL